MNKFSKTEKTIHWLMVFVIAYLGFTAIVNEYWYSKEAIINSLEFSYPMLGLMLPDASELLFIARMLRRGAWDWHFYGGVLLALLLIIKIYLWFYKKKYTNIVLNAVIMPLLIIMTATGILLYERAFNKIDENTIMIARNIHHYSSYILLVVVVIHIIIVIHKKRVGRMI
jgi:cytochrome b561